MDSVNKLLSIVMLAIFCICTEYRDSTAQPSPPSTPRPLCDSTNCDTLNLTGPLTYTTPITLGGGDSACYVTITYWKRQCSQYYDVLIDKFSFSGIRCNQHSIGEKISRATAMLLMNKLGDIPLPFPPTDSAGTTTWRVIRPSCWKEDVPLEYGNTWIVSCTPHKCCVSYYKAKRAGADCHLTLTWIPAYSIKPECGTVEDPHSFQVGCTFNCEENVLDSFKD